MLGLPSHNLYHDQSLKAGGKLVRTA